MSLLPKPDFRGRVDGQCRTVYWRVKTGKRFPWTPPGRAEPIWLPVVEGRVIICWVWDAQKREWIDGDTWKARRSGPNAGQITVTKHNAVQIMLAARQRRTNKILKAKAKKRKQTYKIKGRR